MTIRELVRFLRQFDQNTRLWVIYDTFIAYPVSFGRSDCDTVRRFEKDGIRTGDLIMEVG